ncbi:hypothetical protein AURDEDRAFT_166627, partial [Auricularia subglabra TFB-10046 SS5]
MSTRTRSTARAEAEAKAKADATAKPTTRRTRARAESPLLPALPPAKRPRKSQVAAEPEPEPEPEPESEPEPEPEPEPVAETPARAAVVASKGKGRGGGGKGKPAAKRRGKRTSAQRAQEDAEATVPERLTGWLPASLRKLQILLLLLPQFSLCSARLLPSLTLALKSPLGLTVDVHLRVWTQHVLGAAVLVLMSLDRVLAAAAVVTLCALLLALEAAALFSGLPCLKVVLWAAVLPRLLLLRLHLLRLLLLCLHLLQPLLLRPLLLRPLLLRPLLLRPLLPHRVSAGGILRGNQVAHGTHQEVVPVPERPVVDDATLEVSLQVFSSAVTGAERVGVTFKVVPNPSLSDILAGVRQRLPHRDGLLYLWQRDIWQAHGHLQTLTSMSDPFSTWDQEPANNVATARIVIEATQAVPAFSASTTTSSVPSVAAALALPKLVVRPNQDDRHLSYIRAVVGAEADHAKYFKVECTDIVHGYQRYCAIAAADKRRLEMRKAKTLPAPYEKLTNMQLICSFFSYSRWAAYKPFEEVEKTLQDTDLYRYLTGRSVSDKRLAVIFGSVAAYYPLETLASAISNTKLDLARQESEQHQRVSLARALDHSFTSPFSLPFALSRASPNLSSGLAIAHSTISPYQQTWLFPWTLAALLPSPLLISPFVPSP